MPTEHAAAIRPLCDLFRVAAGAYVTEARIGAAAADRIQAEVECLLALWQSGQLDPSLVTHAHNGMDAAPDSHRNSTIALH